ncbi:hypothetical protein ACP275_03G053800 [Erythranthe tilingii]
MWWRKARTPSCNRGCRASQSFNSCRRRRRRLAASDIPQSPEASPSPGPCASSRCALHAAAVAAAIGEQHSRATPDGGCAAVVGVWEVGPGAEPGSKCRGG